MFFFCPDAEEREHDGTWLVSDKDKEVCVANKSFTLFNVYYIYIYNLNYFCLLGSVYKIVSVNGLNYGYFLKTRWEQKICKFINEQYFSKKV